ncbi:hypothetical protein [Pectobacterium phage Mimer]
MFGARLKKRCVRSLTILTSPMLRFLTCCIIFLVHGLSMKTRFLLLVLILLLTF